MQFIAKMSGFSSIINVVAEAATKCIDKSYDGSGKITLTAGKSDMLATAFGGRVGIRTSISDATVDNIDYECETPGEVTVSATGLLGALARFSTDEHLRFLIQKSDKDTMELYISKQNDAEQYQTLPCLDTPVKLPTQATTYIKEATIDRTSFIYGFEKISFALGFETDKHTYSYWVMRTNKSNMRLVSGNGGSFACIDLSSPNMINATPEITSFVFHKDHSPVVIKILSMLKDEKAIIKESDPTSKDASYQTTITSGPCEIIIMGADPNLSWPDENKLFGANYNYKIITKMADWDETGRGVKGAFDEELRRERKIQVAKLYIDLDKNLITVDTVDMMKTKCKISVIDHAKDDKVDSYWKDGKMPEFSCASPYLRDISEHGSGDGNIQMEFIAPNKPVLVRYHAGDKVLSPESIKKENSTTGISETFSILFATMND